MHRWEKTLREDGNNRDRKNPSFSTRLLDEIYRSIDEGDKGTTEELKFYRETMGKKQSRSCGKSNRQLEGEEAGSRRRACLIEEWIDKKVSEKAVSQRRNYLSELERKSHHQNDVDQDVLFFSSTSSSSDSSSGGFSSSDTDSMSGLKSKSSCFAPTRPKPIRTSVSVRPERTDRKHRDQPLFDGGHCGSATEETPRHEDAMIKSKSRALKIYSNLKKVKQPISPGGRVANFLNSLFTTGNTKKTKSLSTGGGYDDATAERKSKSVKASTCSSASSFSRSCLSKNSPSSREKLRNGVKRTVRFCPVSVIVDEDCRPCGHKCLYEEKGSSPMLESPVPTGRKMGQSYSRGKIEEDLKLQVIEKTRRVEEAAREFLRDYHQNQRKNEAIMRDFRGKKYQKDDAYEDDDDDDAISSCSSSDLFELDHLAVTGNRRYYEELPVYETTRVDANRAISNGLTM